MVVLVDTGTIGGDDGISSTFSLSFCVFVQCVCCFRTESSCLSHTEPVAALEKSKKRSTDADPAGTESIAIDSGRHHIGSGHGIGWRGALECGPSIGFETVEKGDGRRRRSNQWLGDESIVIPPGDWYAVHLFFFAECFVIGHLFPFRTEISWDQKSFLEVGTSPVVFGVSLAFETLTFSLRPFIFYVGASFNNPQGIDIADRSSWGHCPFALWLGGHPTGMPFVCI